MFKTFITSFQIKNAYRVNSIIYSIRQFPFIKKILPSHLYKNKVLKTIGNIGNIIIELYSIFIAKALYIGLCVFFMSTLYNTNIADTFIHIFLILTLIGGVINTYMFNPTKEKYYAMILMNMDARQYTLSNYSYMMLKILIGNLPTIIIFGSMSDVPMWLCLLLLFLVMMVKSIVNAYTLKYYQYKHIVRNENQLSSLLWGIVAVLLAICYGLPYIEMTISTEGFIAIFLICFVLFIPSIKIIYSFKDYQKLYKQILIPKNVYIVENQTSSAAIKQQVAKYIEIDTRLTSNKHGFAYFHELFVKRHRKILVGTIKKQSIIIVGIFIILSVVISVNKDIRENINGLLLVNLPYFLFVMYVLNRGPILTQAMFMNCDHSMLTFRIYRTPKVILGLFKERLKTLIFINLIPAFIIAIGLMFLLYLSGGTEDVINYILLFVSIVSMSVFFSVHYLVLYYLLQPYNINTEMKSSTYSVIQFCTYFVCYFMLGQKMPLYSFGIFVTVFSILYCFISLILVYNMAPKTFKIRN